MRRGVNPEKFKNFKNTKFKHRIIVPVFIPNDREDYYLEAPKIFDRCLKSLIDSTSKKTTAITIINNNSSERIVGPILQKYRTSIDKIVAYNNNKGKVYAVISEAKSCYEEFLTIADSDILFFSGWEHAVFRIFQSFKNTGVVSPIPAQSLAFNHNSSTFLNNFFFGRVKYGKVVDDKACDLFIRGLGNLSALNRSNKPYSWRQKQYYLESNGELAVIGCGHYVSTYRRDILMYNRDFPSKVFENGFEDQYLDSPADRFGLYRLSTNQLFAYHMGNRFEEFHEIDFSDSSNSSYELIQNVKLNKLRWISTRTWFLRKMFFRIIKKIFQL